MTFPELEHRCKIFTETMLQFLIKLPSAKIIRATKPKEIAKALIHIEGKRKRVFISADEIIQMAKASVASGSVAKELILSEKIETLLYLEEKKNKITGVLVKTCQSMRVDDLEITTSIDGINNINGSTFLAELGEMNHFKSHKHVIAFPGFQEIFP